MPLSDIYMFLIACIFSHGGPTHTNGEFFATCGSDDLILLWKTNFDKISTLHNNTYLSHETFIRTPPQIQEPKILYVMDMHLDIYMHLISVCLPDIYILVKSVCS